MVKKIKWGLLGCAGIAEKQFLPALASVADGELWAIASSDLQKAKNWADKWGAKKAYGSYEELLEDPELDAIYLPLPNHLHKEWTIKALEAKKHVLCEKPLAISSSEVEQMFKTAQQEERLLMEAFMYSFHPQIEQTLTWIKAGEIGKIRLMKGSFSFLLTDPDNIRIQNYPGAGSIWDVGCYPIHLMNLIYQRAPLTVTCQGVQKDDKSCDLQTVGVLDYGEGQLGCFDSSFITPQRTSFEVIGEKGRIVIPEPWRPDLKEVFIELIKENGSEKVSFPSNNPYELEIKHFQACIRGEESLFLTEKESDNLIRTITACYRSLETGKITLVEK